MAILSRQRHRFTLAAVLMGLICVLGVFYLVAPITSSTAQKQQQLLEKQQELRRAEEQTKPIQKLPELVSKAQSDIAQFYGDRLAAYPSVVYDNVYELARRNHVALSEVKYETYDTDVPALQLMQVEARVSGNYADLVRFINAVERNRLFFVIDGLQLSDSKGKDQETVQLTLVMETYLRPRGANDKPVTIARKAERSER